ARRSGDTLDIDVPHERLIGVAVEDADDLLHPGPDCAVLSVAAGPGEGLVDIACNRPRLVHAKPGVFEGGDLSERVSHPVFGWRSSWRKDIDRDEFVRDALFFERETKCAHIDAVGRAEDDWVASSLHQMSLE